MKLKKIIIVLTLISTFVLSLGFGANAKTFRVAVIMPSSISDLAFSQSMYDALLTIQEEIGKENLIWPSARACTMPCLLFKKR
jgi:basic membrane protein A